MFISVALFSACSGDDAAPAGPPDEIEAVPFEETRTLSSSDLALLENARPDGLLTFRRTPSSLSKVERGDILVAGASDRTPSGLLRVVTQVNEERGGLRLQTINAPIQLAFRKLHVRVARAGELISPESTDTPSRRAGLRIQALDIDGPRGSVSKTETFDYALFDGDGDENTDDDRIVLSGEIGGTVDYQFGMDFDWGLFEHLPETVSDCIDHLVSGEFDCSLDALIPEAKVSFTADTTLSAEAKLEGAALLSFEREFPILPPQALAQIPLGILVLAPVVKIEGKIEGGASGRFETGISAAATIESGVDISSKRLGSPSFHGPTLSDVDFDVSEPSVALEAHARAEVTATVNLLLYDVAGPSASASVFAEVAADPFGDPCYAMNAGIEADLGIVIEPTLPFLGSVTLFDWHAPTWTPYTAPIVQGSCSRPPMASMLPPGSGADADHYAMPAFEPWSELISAPIDGTVAVSPTDDAASVDLQRSIDGRYLVAGSTGRSLLKLDESGALTWARSYKLEDSAAALNVIATTAARDANLFALAQDAITADVVLTALDQAGEVIEAGALQLPFAMDCTPIPRGLIPDDSFGVWIAGSCRERERAWFVHATRALQFGAAIELATADRTPIALTALTSSEGDPVLGGRLTRDGGDQMFVARFNPSGELRYARTYVGCDESRDLAPRAAVQGDNGDVTFVGSGGGNHNGFVVRIRRDGSVGFASFPGLSFGVGEILALQNVAELPTTGYIATASTQDLLGDARTTTPAFALLGLDAIGKVRWAARYTLLDEDGAARASGFPGIKLTDDGGAYVAGIAAPSGDEQGAVWAFKALAKDGAIMFDTTRAERVPLTPSNLDCDITASDAPLELTTSAASGRSVELERETLMPEHRSLRN